MTLELPRVGLQFNEIKISTKYLRFDFFTAYDFLNSNKSNFNVSIWYNSSYSEQSSSSPLGDDSDVLLRIPRSVNLVSIGNLITC